MKINPARLIRIATAAFLLILLVLIGWNFISQSRKKPKVPVKPDEIATKKVEKREKIEHFEVKGERGNFKVRADKHYMGDDNKYHLEGNVEVVFFQRREGKDVFLYAEEVIYDQDWNHFLAKGEGRVRFKDVLIESTALDYDNQREIFSTKERVQFSSKALSGSAERMVYSLKEERFKLQDNISLRIRPHLETSFPLEVMGKRLEYSRRLKKGIMEGEVWLTHGRSLARADYCEFDLFANEEQIKSLFLKGRVRATIREEGREASPQGAAFVLHGTRREIRADEIRLRGFLDIPKVHALEAKGSCSFKFFSDEGGSTLIEGESIEFVLTREGQLREFQARGKVKIVEQDEKTDEIRIIEGDTINAEADKILNVRRNKDIRPRILFKGNEIDADEIFLFLESGDLEVKGGVKMALQLGKGEKKQVGFFSKDKPIFILVQEMRYSEENKRFLFRKETKMWQEKCTLMAEKVTLNEEEGLLFCSGSVKTIVPYKHKDKEEERMEVSAETMSFVPEENVVSFSKKSSLKLKNIHLQAQYIHVHLKKEGEMERIVAETDVIVVQNGREGQGQEGVYELEKETLVLLGNPVLIDKDKGRIRGDKLTFYMGDGRIVVENKERERSVTVIKS